MERVRTLDSAWLYVESPSTPMHVGSVQIFTLPRGAGRGYVKKLVDAARSAADVRSPYSLKLHRSAMAALLPSWEDDPHPDLEYHVCHHALPSPGGDRELEDLVAQLQSEELDMTRPLWECHVIEGLARRRFAMFTKFHHSVIDGISGMHLLASGLSTDPHRRGQPAPWCVHPEDRKAPAAAEHHPARESAVRRFLHLANGQMHAIPSLVRMAKAFGQAARHPESSSLTVPYKAPKSVLNVPVSRHHRVATLELSMDRVHRLAHQAGVTLNDVFLALCASALRRYLQERGALPDQPLVAGLPVSIRPAGDTTIGTLVTFILSSLGTEIEDPLERLSAIHRATSAAKAELQKLDRAALTEYTLLLMGPFSVKLASGLGAVGHPVFNLTISNVPGPAEPLYFNGARLEAIYPTSIITHGQALNITVVSYAGHLDVGFTACSVALPHVERLPQLVSEACDELEGLLLPPRRRRVTARSDAEVLPAGH